MIDAKMIAEWKTNYGLNLRSPEEAGRWWNKHLGVAPAGAVAALGLCIEEIERLRSDLIAEAARVPAEVEKLKQAAANGAYCRRDHAEVVQLENERMRELLKEIRDDLDKSKDSTSMYWVARIDAALKGSLSAGEINPVDPAR